MIFWNIFLYFLYFFARFVYVLKVLFDHCWHSSMSIHISLHKPLDETKLYQYEESSYGAEEHVVVSCLKKKFHNYKKYIWHFLYQLSNININLSNNRLPELTINIWHLNIGIILSDIFGLEYFQTPHNRMFFRSIQYLNVKIAELKPHQSTFCSRSSQQA